MLATLQRLGVAASRSRPAVSNDNPFSEALFRTLKYRPQLPVKPLSSLLHARRWVTQLVHWYNHEPAQRDRLRDARATPSADRSIAVARPSRRLCRRSRSSSPSVVRSHPKLDPNRRGPPQPGEANHSDRPAPSNRRLIFIPRDNCLDNHRPCPQ